ncbi:MAG: carbohydrate-binding protein, partial [Bacteroidota bacterium]
IPANGSYVLTVNFTGAGSNSTAILEVAYGANSTAQITLNGSGSNGQDPPSITPVSTIEADAGDNIFQTVEVIDDGVPAVSIVIYDVSVYGTNNPFVPGGTVPTNAYSFTDGGNGLYELNWNTQNIDEGAYEARVTVNDGINPPVMEVFDINIAQDLLARLETNTFNNPDPWYGSSPQSPYTVSVASGPVGNIGWIDNGDFVEYLVDVPSAGTYDLLVWAAKGNNGVATVTFSEENGTGGFNAIGSVAVPKSPNPSPWNNYQGFTTQVSFTNAGVQTLRLDFNAAVNVDYLDFSTPQIFYTITAAAGPDGAISPNGTTSVLQGGNQSYSITPNPNYEIADVLVDGVSQGAISSYTFSNVNADATITASFSAIPVFYNITATAGPNGSISPNGTVSVGEGGSQSFTITPLVGYEVADVVVNGVSQGAITSYTFNNVTSDGTISASFSAIPVFYNITATAGPNGSISPNGTVS